MVYAYQGIPKPRVASPPYKANPALEALAKEGYVEYKKGSYDSALELFKRADKYPYYIPLAILGLGETYEALGKDKDALKSWTRLVHPSSDVIEAMQSLSFTPDLARICNDPLNKVHYAIALVKNGRWSETVDAYNEVNMRSHLYVNSVSITDLFAFTKFSPDSDRMQAALHFILGSSFPANRMMSNAERAGQFKEAMRLLPKSALVACNYAGVLWMDNRPKEALEVYRKAEKLAGSDQAQAKSARMGIVEIEKELAKNGVSQKKR